MDTLNPSLNTYPWDNLWQSQPHFQGLSLSLRSCGRGENDSIREESVLYPGAVRLKQSGAFSLENMQRLPKLNNGLVSCRYSINFRVE